jgi:ParB-like chromosome segregation protein Spo0J
MTKLSIDGARKDCWNLDPDDVVVVTREMVEDDPDLAQFYDKRADLPPQEDLVQSIMLFGVKQTILIKKMAESVYVVDGRQRTKACREANERLRKLGQPEKKVPAILQIGSESDVVESMILTNEHRLEDGIMAKAEKASRYIASGRTPKETAVLFGVKPATIKHWLSLLDLTPSVRKAVDAGQIAASAAAKLVSLPSAEQKEALAEALAAPDAPKPTGKKLTALARSARAKATGQRPRTVRTRGEIEQAVKLVKGKIAEKVLLWVLGGEIDWDDLG